jgi:hypothetical protein
VRAALWRGFKIQVRGVSPLKTGVVYRSTSIFQIHLYFSFYRWKIKCFEDTCPVWSGGRKAS